jgi:hypothetical protein
MNEQLLGSSSYILPQLPKLVGKWKLAFFVQVCFHPRIAVGMHHTRRTLHRRQNPLKWELYKGSFNAFDEGFVVGSGAVASCWCRECAVFETLATKLLLLGNQRIGQDRAINLPWAILGPSTNELCWMMIQVVQPRHDSVTDGQNVPKNIQLWFWVKKRRKRDLVKVVVFGMGFRSGKVMEVCWVLEVNV